MNPRALLGITLLRKQKKKKIEAKLEEKIRKYEINAAAANEAEYENAREQYDALQNKKLLGLIIRSKCTMYESYEKSTRFFLTLETANQQRCTISKLFDENDNLLTNKDEILQRIKKIYMHLFEKKMQN